MIEPCQVCIELQRAGIDVPCSLCDAPDDLRVGNTSGNRNGRVLATPDRQSEIPKDSSVREGGLEPPHG